MASKKLILTKLTTMAVIYNRSLTVEELKLLVDVWEEAFKFVSDAIFEKHCDYHVKENKTFPTPAHLVNGCEHEQSFINAEKERLKQDEEYQKLVEGSHE